ncbi:MAG: hypothetical protein ACRD8U_12470 [Pyrinomonadaceae bacterium]
MKHPAYLAFGLLLFVVLACNLGKRNTNSTSTANENTAGSSSAVITEINMARDDGKGDPGNESGEFSPSDRTIHCVVRLTDAKAGTKMTFSWWVVDADNTQNEKIKDIEYTTRALENVVHSHLTLPQDWPKGKYKVEVYVNGNLEKTIGYMVA